MAAGYNVRIGDADREEVAAQLREHYADGRLTFEELNERLDQTFAAKTKADLGTVLRDLPQGMARTGGTPGGGAGWPGPGWPGPGWQGQAWQGQAWQGPLAPRSDYRRDGWEGGCRRPHGAFAAVMSLVWVFVILGSLMLFGLGGDRPLLIVVFLAAIALVRRLFGLGRRRSRGPRGPRGPGRW